MRPFTVRWKNFHGFRDTKPLRIAPLTVLLGPNNSGKSSLFAPLLLMKQSVESMHAEPTLLTRGELINAGGYRDLAHGGRSDLPITFEVRFNRQVEPDDEACDSPFHYPPTGLRVTFVADQRTDEATLAQYQVFNVWDQLMVSRRLTKSGRYSVAGVKFSDDSPASEFDRLLRQAIRNDRPRSFLFNSFVASSGAARQRSHPEETGREVSTSVDHYMTAIDFLFWDTVRFLGEIKYLGPLREAPHRVYQLEGTRPTSVGINGKRAPEVLFHNTDVLLERHLGSWLERFGFPERISTEDLGEGSFSVYLTPRDTTHKINFADMGFGLSQVLPLVVESLLCQNGELLIVEQPEIHLNPKLQAELADLFADLISRDGQLIVETHSEHFLLRLRRLVAEERIPAESVALYFVERDGDQSSVREVPVEGDGHIRPDAWPKDFFGETLQESMALAIAQAERVKRS